MGIYQACKGYEPFVIHAVLSFTKQRFGQNQSSVKNLFNRPHHNSDDVDKWTTATGIRKTLNNFSVGRLESNPLKLPTIITWHLFGQEY